MLVDLALSVPLVLLFAVLVAERRGAKSSDAPRARVPDKIQIDEEALQGILESVGSFKPETGGLLGGSVQEGVISTFQFDEAAIATESTYSPDVDLVNSTIERWTKQGVDFLGFVHSHPGGLSQLSNGDLTYARQILDANPDLPYLVLPILAFDANEQPSLVVHIAYMRSAQIVFKRLEAVVIPTAMAVNETPADDGGRSSELAGTHPQFSRIAGAVDIHRMQSCRVVIVGVGGASQLAIDLVRTGIGEVVLIDHDIVEAKNLASQSFGRSDIGRSKVNALARRLYDASACVAVVKAKTRVEDLSAKALSRLALSPWKKGPHAGQRPLETVFIAATDSFEAQTYVGDFVQRAGFPLVAGQLFAQGDAGEVAYFLPGQTSDCMRCRLKDRYDAYAAGYADEVTTQGATVMSTRRLGVLEHWLTLALLHHGTSHERWGDLLAQACRDNYGQFRVSPFGPTKSEHPQAGSDDGTLWYTSDPGTSCGCRIHAASRS